MKIHVLDTGCFYEQKSATLVFFALQRGKMKFSVEEGHLIVSNPWNGHLCFAEDYPGLVHHGVVKVGVSSCEKRLRGGNGNGCVHCIFELPQDRFFFPTREPTIEVPKIEVPPALLKTAWSV